MKLDQLAADALRRALQDVPDSKLVIDSEKAHDPGVDLVAHIDHHGERRIVVAEVKASGQPRHVKSALFQLKRYAQEQAQPITPLVIAPYLSEGARALCIESQVGYLDFEGNTRIAFPGFFLSREVASKPQAERRELRSLFKPKSAQVLRTMLRDPSQAWRVVDLCTTADVSAGQVSYVRSGLLDRGWAEVSDNGVFLSNPDALLDAWREEYQQPAGHRWTFYTTMHGSALDDALRSMGGGAAEDRGLAILASFSAANWLAPYGRTGTQYFYADREGAQRLRDALKLSPTSRGENLVITVLDELGPLRDFIEPAPGIYTTGLIQTYLDLYAAGERGREAAEHLRKARLQWKK